MKLDQLAKYSSEKASRGTWKNLLNSSATMVMSDNAARQRVMRALDVN